MYEETSNYTIKYVVIGLLILVVFLGLLFLPLSAGKAQTGTTSTAKTKTPSFADSISANTLCSAGLGCDKASAQTSTQTASSGGILGGLFGGSGSKTDPKISVVNVKGDSAVYVIVDGKKHSLPTTEIFQSYGYSLSIVQDISQDELDKYPLARLFIVQGTEKDDNPQIYFLTEG